MLPSMLDKAVAAANSIGHTTGGENLFRHFKETG